MTFKTKPDGIHLNWPVCMDACNRIPYTKIRAIYRARDNMRTGEQIAEPGRTIYFGEIKPLPVYTREIFRGSNIRAGNITTTV